MMTTPSLFAQDPEPQSQYRITAYFTAWSIYARSYYITDIPADKLTHINYAFANVSEEGEVVLGDEWADVQYPYPNDAEDTPLKGNFHQLQLLKEQYPHLQTLISVGGWTWSGRFSDAALTEESRQRFAASAVNFMLEYGFDGIDIDWEYPTGGGLQTNKTRPEDPENFILLLQELRHQLDAQGEQDGRHYLLTIAAGAGRSAYEPLNWDEIHPLLDWINIMTFDMSGGWSDVTGFNAPLYNSTANPPEGGSVDSAIQAFLAKGVPAEKLGLSVPFYGHGFNRVEDENNGLHQPFVGMPGGTWEPGSYDYKDLTAHYIGRFQRFWDDTAQVPWLYDPDSGVMISYDDPESIALKAEYVREHGLGGMMIWELSADDNAELLSTMYDTLNQ